MTWFFAAVIVALVGVVAVVAVGRGQQTSAELTPAEDDRPELDLPAHGPLGAADVRGVRFTTAFRGYRMSEVDALLDRVAGQLDDPDPDPAHAQRLDDADRPRGDRR